MFVNLTAICALLILKKIMQKSQQNHIEGLHCALEKIKEEIIKTPRQEEVVRRRGEFRLRRMVPKATNCTYSGGQNHD